MSIGIFNYGYIIIMLKLLTCVSHLNDANYQTNAADPAVLVYVCTACGTVQYSTAAAQQQLRSVL